ncbi:hypothetical protein KC356_g152 [Hortaea werneckii]|nr:hypothetical protein KC356_g152 [Hortaea werneckii]
MDLSQYGGGILPDNSGTNQQQRATPQHPFYSLPSELILDIVDLLPPESFINFAFANYPLLHSYGLAPALSRPRVVYLTTQTQIPALFPLLNLPPEIMLHVMRNLKPIDIMRFTVANYQDLARQGIAPSLGEETVQQLRNASARHCLNGLPASGARVSLSPYSDIENDAARQVCKDRHRVLSPSFLCTRLECISDERASAVDVSKRSRGCQAYECSAVLIFEQLAFPSGWCIDVKAT